jgi:hypothetical protein
VAAANDAIGCALNRPKPARFEERDGGVVWDSGKRDGVTVDANDAFISVREVSRCVSFRFGEVEALKGRLKRANDQRLRHLTRTRSATAGEGARGCELRGSSHENHGRTPARGWLHRMVRRLAWLDENARFSRGINGESLIVLVVVVNVEPMP